MQNIFLIIDDILGIETDSQMGNKATKGVYCSQGKAILPLILSHQRIYSKSTIIYNQATILGNCLQNMFFLLNKVSKSAR